ncbi:hypothetical protein [Haliangium sp.]|uniref:hypothetical protein n=1 Tax=Haliangium sp. TaxID=2663208 RepID=UPI003D0EE120
MTGVAAEEKRVAVVGMAPSLVIAVSSTLEPWQIEVVAPLLAVPTGSFAAMTRRGRAIADGNQAAATIWIAPADSGATLLVYDRDEDKIIALPLVSPPPFDGPTTAAVALSVKTLLRHSGLVPPEPGPTPPQQPHRLLVDLLTVVHVRPGVAASTELRFGVAARWILDLARRHLAVAARVHTGTGIDVQAPGFVGRYTDTSVGLAAEGRLALGRRVAVGLAAGSTLHVTELSGRLDRDISERRLNPAIDLALRFELRLWRLELGLWGQGSYLTRRQEYMAGADTLLDLPALEAGAGIFLGLPMW